MVKTDDMMSIEDVTNILGLPLLGVIPDSEKIIVASNRGEPIVLEIKPLLPRVAFDNTAKRLTGEDIDFLDFNSSTLRIQSNVYLGRFVKNKLILLNFSFINRLN